MKHRLYLLAIAALLISCNGNKPERDYHGEMRAAADKYYTLLMDGRYEDFVDGLYTPDSLPADYRSQLVDAVAQYRINETQRRGGLEGFQVVGDSLGPDSCSGFVTIQLLFGDKSTEEILLPLVDDQGVWKMK